MNSLKKELVSGVFYIAVAKYSGILFQIVVSAILARLLSPTDFGIVAVATVIITFFSILSDIGIGPAIIQKKELNREDLKSIFSFTVILGFIIASLFFSLAGIIADYYKNEVLVSICRLLSLQIFFSCMNIVPQNLQYKAKRFRFTAFTTLGVQIGTGVIAVTGAFNGIGIYALTLSPICSPFLLFLIYNYRERLGFTLKIQKTSMKKIMRFSIYQFMFNLINYFSRNLDKLLIGRFIGLSPLGYYEKSYRLMMMPLQNITFIVTPVMQPIFSTFQNNLYELGAKYQKILVFLAYISFPLSAFCFFSARELILLFFGPQWEGAIIPFQILSLTVSLQILTSTSGSIYQSANATKQLFISGCWCTFFMVSGFLLTIFIWGNIEAVSYGFLFAQLANTTQCFYLLFKTLGYPLRSIIWSMRKPFCVGIIVFVVLFAINFILSDNNMFFTLFVKLIIAGIISLLLTQLLGDYNVIGYFLKLKMRLCNGKPKDSTD